LSEPVTIAPTVRVKEDGFHQSVAGGATEGDTEGEKEDDGLIAAESDGLSDGL